MIKTIPEVAYYLLHYYAFHDSDYFKRAKELALTELNKRNNKILLSSIFNKIYVQHYVKSSGYENKFISILQGLQENFINH